MGSREPLGNVLSAQDCPLPICPQSNGSASANQEAPVFQKSLCPPTFRHRCRTERPKPVYPEPNSASFKPLSTCPPCPSPVSQSSCSLEECSAIMPKVSCPKVECPPTPSPLPCPLPPPPESNPFSSPSPNSVTPTSTHLCPPCPSPQPLRPCNPDECPSPPPPPPCPSPSPQISYLTASHSPSCPPPPPCPNAGTNTALLASSLGCPQQQPLVQQIPNFLRDCPDSNECNNSEEPVEEKRYRRRHRNRRYRTNYRVRKAKVSRRLSRSVQNKIAKVSDDNTDLPCNSAVLADIMIKVLSEDVARSKQKIQQEAEAKLSGKFNVICSKSEFAYVSHANTFCEVSNKYVICYAFRASDY